MHFSTLTWLAVTVIASQVAGSVLTARSAATLLRRQSIGPECTAQCSSFQNSASTCKTVSCLCTSPVTLSLDDCINCAYQKSGVPLSSVAALVANFDQACIGVPGLPPVSLTVQPGTLTASAKTSSSASSSKSTTSPVTTTKTTVPVVPTTTAEPVPTTTPTPAVTTVVTTPTNSTSISASASSTLTTLTVSPTFGVASAVAASPSISATSSVGGVLHGSAVSVGAGVYPAAFAALIVAVAAAL